MTKLIQLESTFWSIYGDVRPDEDIKPINLDHEKVLFFVAKAQGRQYNPQFVYRDGNNLRYMAQLRQLIEDAKGIGGYIAEQYAIHASKLSDWIEQFSAKGSAFPRWLFELYSTPRLEVLNSAQQTIQKLGFLEEDTEEASAEDADHFFHSTLTRHGFLDWRVAHTKMPSKVKVSSVERTIYINSDSRFSPRELDRLATHEVGTHVVRFENGKKQSCQLFRYGFPRYLECEEGLAIFSEDKAGLLSTYDLGKYCLRVIASQLAEDATFCDVFEVVSKHIDENQAFAIAARVKRGLNDTSSIYGYSKDHLYYSGYLGVRELPLSSIRKLFVGKIGFAQLQELDFGKLAFGDIYIPSWACA